MIATAIPRMTDECNSIQDIGWYGSAYMLTATRFNPISGRIYQLYSTKWGFLLSIVVFEVGLALGGPAPNSIAFHYRTYHFWPMVCRNLYSWNDDHTSTRPPSQAPCFHLSIRHRFWVIVGAWPNTDHA